MDPAGWAFAVNGVGNTVLTAGNNGTVTCTAEQGIGAYNAGSKTTGTIELTLNGCKESVFGANCNSAGQPAGSITTTKMTFTNTYLTDNKTTPGITIRGTGSEEHYATFSCAGGLVQVVVRGTVLGDSELECNTETKEHKFVFESVAHGVQKYMQVTGTGSTEDLTVTMNGGAAVTASIDSTTILKSNEAGKITCV